jgi:hypothetical protein
MPAGSSRKREHEYEKLKDEFKAEHRYPDREDEVAARIVNKQRAAAGETKGARPAAKKAGAAKKTATARKGSKTSSRHTRH